MFNTPSITVLFISVFSSSSPINSIWYCSGVYAITGMENVMLAEVSVTDVITPVGIKGCLAAATRKRKKSERNDLK